MGRIISVCASIANGESFTRITTREYLKTASHRDVDSSPRLRVILRTDTTFRPRTVFVTSYVIAAFSVSGQREYFAGVRRYSLPFNSNGQNRDRSSSLYSCISAGLACGFYLGQHARAERLFIYGLEDADRGPVVFQEMRARPWLARLYVMMNRVDDAAAQIARCRQIMADGEDWRGLEGTVEPGVSGYSNDVPYNITSTLRFLASKIAGFFAAELRWITQ